ncbi:MAG TPA: 2-phosphosulfolactate phosphatase, partial [Prochlorococcaceae cyanobacterium Fu_MAG_50]|nr:2-phosphosulfolactate phosphatase [Prochlorococcaceae cyanobacterium Fu_MAG_50]
MKISYFHVAADVPDAASALPDAAVVIDVLRATTTIAWALHNGADAVEA